MRPVRWATTVALLGAAITPRQASAQVSVFVEKGPAVGAVAADFTAVSVTADTLAAPGSFSLWKTRGQVVVLAFFPKVFMSGSDTQFATFRDRYAELFGEGVTVVGVSADATDELGRYANYLRLPLQFLSDPGQKIGTRFGLVIRPGQPTRRAVYVVGRDGAVTYRDFRFDPTTASSFDRLRSAVQAARR